MGTTAHLCSQLLTESGQRGERRCGGDAEKGVLQRALTVLRESLAPRAPEDPGHAGGRRKAEGGLAGATRVGVDLAVVPPACRSSSRA